ncbi:MAG TPA: 5-oxoprolinase subunit PxpB, partial [Lacibacter sp.]|nr:5-oxoprolinase subunit PxpB [Lacibacter sp.]
PPGPRSPHPPRRKDANPFSRNLGDKPPAPQLQEPPRRLTLPVCYDPVFGTDLAQLEAELQLPAAEIVRLHSSRTYHVFLLGFTPGFPYMGILPPELHCRRKTTASQTVAAGSVAIAGTQTGIYPLSSPGGWNIIGRTPVSLVNPDQPSPFLLQPGDEVKFTPISREEFEAYENHVPA